MKQCKCGQWMTWLEGTIVWHCHACGDRWSPSPYQGPANNHYWIYVGDREAAKIAGDPCLGDVFAENNEMAVQKAMRDAKVETPPAGAGYWAVECTGCPDCTGLGYVGPLE